MIRVVTAVDVFTATPASTNPGTGREQMAVSIIFTATPTSTNTGTGREQMAVSIMVTEGI